MGCCGPRIPQCEAAVPEFRAASRICWSNSSSRHSSSPQQPPMSPFNRRLEHPAVAACRHLNIRVREGSRSRPSVSGELHRTKLRVIWSPLPWHHRHHRAVFQHKSPRALVMHSSVPPCHFGCCRIVRTPRHSQRIMTNGVWPNGGWAKRPCPQRRFHQRRLGINRGESLRHFRDWSSPCWRPREDHPPRWRPVDRLRIDSEDKRLR
ncbi:hypothetical protein B0T10DRAFT_281443 [Thelonectria olida]|uniref:Uncharacterized protein n=1 Tax=Thelonectria olida TaxID=1576542 RepID=A0A9P9AIB4_9HYPO|nr:hypothetical protein B0T10DRAFT_281443 [Thelonectria olida]